MVNILVLNIVLLSMPISHGFLLQHFMILQSPGRYLQLLNLSQSALLFDIMGLCMGIMFLHGTARALKVSAILMPF